MLKTGGPEAAFRLYQRILGNELLSYSTAA
jgi:hypothetical protein